MVKAKLKVCQKCNKEFKGWWRPSPSAKRRNLHNRKYCLDCSPFGAGNNRDLMDAQLASEGKLKCRVCERPLKPHQKRNSICTMCIHKTRLQRQQDLYFGIVGYACWKCGYDKGKDGIGILDFHHMNRAEKTSNLDSRTMLTSAQSKVLSEMRKCCLLCCRCHREFENGLIDPEIVKQIYAKEWEKREHLWNLAKEIVPQYGGLSHKANLEKVAA